MQSATPLPGWEALTEDVRVGDGVVCDFCNTAVQYIKIALHNNETMKQITEAVDKLCDSAFAGLDAGPAMVECSSVRKLQILCVREPVSCSSRFASCRSCVRVGL